MNFLCPVCDELMSQESDSLFFCKHDALYLCNDCRSFDYGADYLLHYKLYGKTKFGKALNSKRWDFVLNSGLFGPLLDFGCGSDSFIDAKPNGADVFSYDPYFKKDFSFLDTKLDIVTFWDSFEHMTRLGIAPLLNSRQIIMSIPILDEDTDLFSWKHYRPGEHIWYFSDNALVKLLKRWNYNLRSRSSFEIEMGREDVKSYCFTLSGG